MLPSSTCPQRSEAEYFGGEVRYLETKLNQIKLKALGAADDGVSSLRALLSRRWPHP